MTVDEIFASLSAHAIEGLMFHDQMARYYDFLGLRGYKRCHEYHYAEESVGYRKLNRYFTNHYGRLIPKQRSEDPNKIPENWYRFKREDVDPNTKRNAVQSGIESWVTWERDTKTLYEKACKDLFDMGEVAASKKVGKMVKAVDKELKCAERKWIALVSVGYDMISVMACQDDIHDKYKEKLECMEIKL